MVVNKPTIIIYTQEADSDLLHEVCSGIEEEGLLFEVHEKSGELDEIFGKDGILWGIRASCSSHREASTYMGCVP